MGRNIAPAPAADAAVIVQFLERRRLPEVVSAGTLRHDRTVIRDCLGLASITTTNRYVSMNLKMKTDALAAFWKRAGIATAASVPWEPTSTLLEFLRSL